MLAQDIADSLRLHLTSAENGTTKLAAGDVVITPQTEYRLTDGRTWHITDRQWTRLSEVENHVMGHTAVNYLIGTQMCFAQSFPVNIYKPYAHRLRDEIRSLVRTPRYEGYTLGSFVAWLPMRISYSSAAFIVLDRDITTYAHRVQLRPISYHERGTINPSMSVIDNTVDVVHYYKGKRIETSKIAVRGRFQLFGFDFNSIEEAYEGLTLLLESGSVKSGSRIVIPQLKDYNKACVRNELRHMLLDIGKIRSETIRIKVPKIVPTHFDVDSLVIPDFPESSLDIPPC